MKITRSAWEMAVASAKDSEVPLILVGSHGVITDVMISPRESEYDTSAGMLPSMLPAGIRRYGKVITKDDDELLPGYNLIGKDGQWVFVDEDGKEIVVQTIDDPEEKNEPATLEER